MYKLDSRKIEENDIFIDLVGSKKHIDEAIEKNCKYVITELDLKIDKVKKVDNVQNELNKISKKIRKNFTGTLIAVTGSTGKTTTKELIYNILSTKYKTLKSISNDNNHIGVPKTILNLNNDYDICILEMGMNHKGEISNLSNICKPDISVITNIGSSHIGILGSKKNILKAKLEILDGMNDGLLIVNGNDKYLKKVKYENIAKIKLKRNNNLKILDSKLNFNYENTNYIFNIPNKKLINNILISIYIGKMFNIEDNIIKKEIEKFIPMKGRNNIIKCKNYTVIDDTYNASLESIIAGLDMLKNYSEDKIVILGDVLETKDYIYKKLKRKIDEDTILVGENIKKIKKGIHFDNNTEVINYLNKIDLTGKIIYLKASHRMNFTELVDYLINMGN